MVVLGGIWALVYFYNMHTQEFLGEMVFFVHVFYTSLGSSVDALASAISTFDAFP